MRFLNAEGRKLVAKDMAAYPEGYGYDWGCGKIADHAEISSGDVEEVIEGHDLHTLERCG